jgi:hypothetical protein
MDLIDDHVSTIDGPSVVSKPDRAIPCGLAAAWEGRPELSGSASGAFTLGLVSGLCEALPRGGAQDLEELPLGHVAAAQAMREIAPRDPLEGMLTAQLIAVHAAAMECFRRAAIPEQSFEARQANLCQANKLVRSYAALVEALDKHRGKGQPQVVRVERVTVEAGGQAIVGAVSRDKGGGG